LIESAVSSNRIEGVVVDQTRVRSIVLGRSRLRDCDEQEVRGYRNALKLVHERGSELPVSQDTIRRLHRLARYDVGDAGEYKRKDVDIIERYPDDRERVRFRTVAAAKVEPAVQELVDLWDRALVERRIHPLVGLAAFNLDFLCIHPFRDGNGRVSRLLWLLQSCHLGYHVGRYVSLERFVEEHKERYYETLEESSRGWHDGAHDPWPFVNFVFFILRAACQEFESRMGVTAAPRGAKTELVASAVKRAHRGQGCRPRVAGRCRGSRGVSR
jgi:Fic family protein